MLNFPRRRNLKDSFLHFVHPFFFARMNLWKMKTNRLYSRAGERRGGEGRGGSTTWACLQRQRIPRFWPRQFSNKSRGSFQNFRIFDTVALSSSRKEREIPLVPLFYSPLMANCYELFVYPKRQSIKVVSTISTLLLSFCKNIYQHHKYFKYWNFKFSNFYKITRVIYLWNILHILWSILILFKERREVLLILIFEF